jgi:subtilisin-like proprotein convertase family protein
LCALGAVLGLANVALAAPTRDAAISFVDESGQPISGLTVGAVLDDGTFVTGTVLPDGTHFLTGLSEKVQLEIGDSPYGKVVAGLHVTDKFSSVRVLLSPDGAVVTLPSSLRVPGGNGRPTGHALEARIDNELLALPRSGEPEMLGTSNCCIANGGIGCDDPECQATVCAIDSFCCATAWDSICAGEANDLCRICQAGGGRCAGDGSECTTALTAITGNNAGSTIGDGGTDDESSCPVNDFISEWWCWTADCDGTATASTCNQAAYDTTLAVFDGCGGTEIVCLDDAPGCAGFSTTVSWAATAGTEYKIRVSGYNGASGTYTLTLSCEGGAPASNCCVANGGLGCDDPECEAQICAADSFCCATAWDQICADEAAQLCGDLCAGGPGGPCGPPNTNDCCAANGTPGCSDLACCETVCAIDPFCCDTSWDGICQGEAFSLCTDLCGGNQDPCDGTEIPENEPDCGGIGNVGQGSNCCFASGGLGCDDPDCQAAVCAVDAFCCDTAWDGICAGEAATLCPVLCAGGGGAPVDTVNGGCNSAPPVFSPIACGQEICGTTAQGFGFRDTDWYAFTVVGSETNITFTVTANFNFVIGFVDTNNCATAAALDPFATGFPGQTASVTRCFAPGTWWAFVSVNGGPDLPCDGSFVYNAALSCGGPCTTLGACCFSDGSCGDEGDEFACAAAGGTFQGEGTTCLSVVCPVVCGPGAGDCCTANGGLGCNDPACCDAVCSVDAFCCQVAWDSICANEAGDLCPNCVGVTPCGPPNTQDCFQPGSVPGCSDAECCEAVCAVDPFCCDTSWDGICAGEAATICFTGEPPANDDCENAEPISVGGCVDGTTIGSGVDIDAPNCTGGAGITAGGVWYVVTGDGTTLTATTCPGGAGASTCCSPQATPGCDDPTCQAAVCAADAFCCDVAWDGLCSGAAASLCPDLCGAGGGCGGATYDTQINVYCGDCPPGILTCLGANDDFCALQSSVTWCSQAGVDYLILVHGFGAAVGNFNLSVGSDDTECTPTVLCTPVIPTGACCICLEDCSAACETLQEAECAAAGGTYLGDGTSCETSATIDYAANAGTSIPDNNPAGITHVINVPDSFSISDVNVGVNITHTWVGDLCVSLSHGATTVELIQRMGGAGASNCYSGAPFGCAQDNLNVTLDDEAGAPIETQCALNLTGSFIPFASLSAFDGADASGNWTLSVIDNGGGDTGTLNSWSLSFPDPNPVGPCDGFACDSGDPVVECVAELIDNDDHGDDHGDDDDDHGGGGNNDDDDHGGGGNDDDDDSWGWGAALNGGGGDDDDDHNNGGGGNDDDPNVVVSWTASDDCGLASVTGVIDIGCDVIPIESGQQISLKCASEDGNGFWWWWCGDDDDDDSSDGNDDPPCSAIFVDGVLVIESASATLVVTATDLLGNTATCEVDLCALVATDDDDRDDHDDHGDDDDDWSLSHTSDDKGLGKGTAADPLLD